jgi:hypothetical protein
MLNFCQNVGQNLFFIQTRNDERNGVFMRFASYSILSHAVAKNDVLEMNWAFMLLCMIALKPSHSAL